MSFYTLFERKALRSAHIRQGPRVVRVWGLLQPFADGLKLFTKSLNWLSYSNIGSYLLRPLLTIIWVILLLGLLPWSQGLISWTYLPLALLGLTSLGLIPILGAGWGSNSPWASLGAVRCVAQTISYEVSAAFILLLVCWLISSASLNYSALSQTPKLLLCAPLGLAWLFRVLAESNRSPFDFGEAESELVRGLNIEYGAGWFACLFIAEYTRIIFISLLSSCILFSSPLLRGLSLRGAVLFMYCYVWIRATLPRTRYDKLIFVSWFVILPRVLLLLFIAVWLALYRVLTLINLI